MKLRTHKKAQKKILTTEGELVYDRYVLRPADDASAELLEKLYGEKTVVPLDIYLGVDRIPFKISFKLMLDIAYWAVKLDSYQETEDFFRRTYNLTISDDTIREVVNYIGSIVYENDCNEAEKAFSMYNSCSLPFLHNREGTLYIQTDGAALNTRTKDDNDSTWRENKLGLAFSSDNIYYWTSKKGAREHRILSREYISYVGSAQEFKKHLLSLAVRCGYGRYENTVIISDGATWIRSIKEELFPDAQQILDLFHLKENVYEFARGIFNEDANKYVPWAEDICEKLENGKYETVLKSLEKYKDYKTKNGCVNLYTYISNNKDNIDYPSYKEKGYFVGSGAIESGNKVVLQKRLKLPGMRWNVKTAQYVLSLRAKIESGKWESSVIPLVRTKIGVAKKDGE